MWRGRNQPSCRTSSGPSLYQLPGCCLELFVALTCVCCKAEKATAIKEDAEKDLNEALPGAYSRHRTHPLNWKMFRDILKHYIGAPSAVTKACTERGREGAESLEALEPAGPTKHLTTWILGRTFIFFYKTCFWVSRCFKDPKTLMPRFRF